MCGIAVAIDWHGAETAVRRLIGEMLHRGDVTDPLVTVGINIAMCTRRLRIVDAARGVQPQASHDGRYLVCLNGEIYNHVHLRRELEELGIQFHTECDTEVLANVLRVWGPAGIRRLNGMFAFVVVDTATGEFLAARDPFGVKPLYLIQSGGGFLFCSEIRPLLAAADGDVLLLPPGRMLGRNFYGKYSAAKPRSKSAGAAPRDLDRILSDAVRVRLPTDLPAAVLFSGGVDSTLVLHYARRHCANLQAYTAIGQGSRDRDYARHYADETGLNLREVPVEPLTAETVSLIETVVDAVETFEPAVIRPSLHTYVASRRIHEDGFRVALCGEGADELFAGYEPLERAFARADGIGRDLQTQCLNMMHRANLQRIDRCAMRFQLEIREPFLDRSVVSHAIDIDDSILVEQSTGSPVGKAPLRALFDMYPDELPVQIRDRQKMPFHEGVSMSMAGPDWVDLFETAISDADFRDGQRRFADFGIGSKEELFLIRILAARMDISRVPHLRSRLRLDVPSGASTRS